MDLLWLYAALMALAWAAYLWRRRHVDRRSRAQLQQSIEAGLAEPPSLHPVVDPRRCLGSASCIAACPEGALGMVGGKAALINASACIGHGACAAACPLDAIRLVFGTERRGIEIPRLSPEFETNVPGLFIAGELGGMGLIRKAAEQGRQAMEAIRRRGKVAGRGAAGDEHDVLIVGCGPAGLSAGLAAMEHKLRYLLIEQEPSLGGAVFHYPRHKVAMTAPVKLALVGTMRFTDVRKEKLLEFWQGVVARTRLAIRFNEGMLGLAREGDGFVVTTTRGTHRARSVLLAMGRRGTPRKLEVPGEDGPQVVYRLVDPAQYDGQAVLVVGGGDSALEAAIALAERPGTTVTLSYRSAAFSRVKARNRDTLAALQASGRVAVMLESQVLAVESGRVRLQTTQGEQALANDAVIVCVGGQLPIALLQKAGVAFDTHHGA
ncbi:MAG: NAD(P)-binding domain-containing protein [Rubrivivax sp.]|nr:NAD(P)-binding domain-containing protein [Rubrivivax sp.]